MGYPVDGLTDGPGLPQSVWRYKWLVGGLVLLGILGGALLSATQPTRYEAVVPIYLTAEEAAANYPERIVMSRAQFIKSPAVSERVIALTGNRLTPKELERRLTVEPSADGDFITIRAQDATPRDAADLADAVDLAYQQILSEQRKATANGTIAALEGVRRSLASELAQISKQRKSDDSAALQAEEQAKKRQIGATANKIESISADTAGTAVPPPALQDKAAVPDAPVQPKPLRTAAIGAVVGLVIGVALAWFLAARRRVRPSKDTTEFQAHGDNDLDEISGVLHKPVERLRIDEADAHAASAVGATASDIRESHEQVRQLADVDNNRVTESLGDTVNSLNKDHDLLYSLAEWLESQHQNFPQLTAERLKDRFPFDQVAVLLDSDGGLALAGCVGWQPDGVSRVAQHDPMILNKLGANGARQIESAERDELLNAGLLGNENHTIVVAPLKHETVPFGVLLVGQEESGPEAATGNGSFDGIASFARSVAPDLHAWLLLHKLREQLGSPSKAKEQTTSAAVAVWPAAESVPPPAESVPPPAESVPPPAPVSQPAESVPPPPESVQPPAESIAPPAESIAPPAESVPLPAESEPPYVWPTYPAAEWGPPTAPESEPASSIDQQDDHQVGPGHSYRSKRVQGVSSH